MKEASTNTITIFGREGCGYCVEMVTLLGFEVLNLNEIFNWGRIK